MRVEGDSRVFCRAARRMHCRCARWRRRQRGRFGGGRLPRRVGVLLGGVLDLRWTTAVEMTKRESVFESGDQGAKIYPIVSSEMVFRVTRLVRSPRE